MNPIRLFTSLSSHGLAPDSSLPSYDSRVAQALGKNRMQQFHSVPRRSEGEPIEIVGLTPESERSFVDP
jgi:hypothetical protein